MFSLKVIGMIKRRIMRKQEYEAIVAEIRKAYRILSEISRKEETVLEI
jgi:hypothetical protein